MSRFKNVLYFNDRGETAPVDVAHPDNPITSMRLRAKQFWGTRIIGVSWGFERSTKEIKFSKKIFSAIVDPVADLLLVSVSFKEPSYHKYDNAIVLNPDGSLHHRIVAPRTVEHDFRAIGSTSFEMECISSVGLMYQTDILAIDLLFNREWIQQRGYNPITREWGPVLHVYRQ